MKKKVREAIMQALWESNCNCLDVKWERKAVAKRIMRRLTFLNEKTGFLEMEYPSSGRGVEGTGFSLN